MKKLLATILLVIMTSSLFFVFPTWAQENKPCEQCGMTVDATGQARYRIVDAEGDQHVACCPVCALRMVKTYGQLNITSFCDYNGPGYPITIVAKQNGSALTVNPTSALVILGGGCAKNRLVYNAGAADALLAPPNNGGSVWLSPLSNATVLPNATRLGLAQAVLQYGGGATGLCEQCGMTVDVTGQARFKIFDTTGTLHIACCPVCTLKMLKTQGDLNITSFCDYNGPTFPINIIAKNYGSEVTVTPSTALILVGGSCTKNRIVFDNASADNLLSPPNNGTSKWLSPLTNATVLPNATRLGVAQAALQFGGGNLSPSPSPTASSAPSWTPSPTQQPTQTATPRPSSSASASPATSQSPVASASPAVSATPASTPTPTAPSGQQQTPVTEQECEPCGMVVTADDQWHFKVTDGNGQIHYVECFMCALNLIKRYDTLHIETFCDWYGPEYPIIIDSTGKGAQVTVSPTNAMYLYTGSCENNRVAYNETASEALKTNYSQHTSLFQQHAWDFTPTVVTVAAGVNMYNEMSPEEGAKSTMLPVLVGAIVAIVVLIGVVAFLKLRKRK